MKYTRLVFTDLNGCLRGKYLPATIYNKDKSTRAARSVMAQDIEGEESEVLEEFAPDHHDRDIILVADESASYTSHLDPDVTTVMADYQEKDGTDHPIAPRTILKRSIEQLRSTGYDLKCATEIEFYLTSPELDILTNEPTDEPYGGINSINSIRPFLDDMQKITENIGLETEGILNEAGSGQFEITFQADNPLAMADKTMFFKQALRDTAKKHGKSVSFLAKHDVHNVSSSQHVHMSLWKNGKQASAEDPSLLESFIAGQVLHAHESFALYCPNPNSFRRYILGQTYVSWLPNHDEDNRRASFRISGDKGNQHLENRIPGADANVYLILAAAIFAGTEGITNSLTYEDAEVAKSASTTFPLSQDHALSLFESSKFIKNNFGEDFAKLYVGVKRQELTRFAEQITKWELQTFGRQV